MASTLNVSSFSREVYPALRKVIFDEFDTYDLQFKKITNNRPTDRWYEEFTTEAGLGLFEQTGDGEDYIPDQMFDGFYTKVQLFKFTKMFRVSEDLMRFGKYVTMGNRARNLGRVGNTTMDILGHVPYNQGFTQVLSDGQPLFSTAHPGFPGNSLSLSNVLTTQASLSYTSFNAALTQIRLQTDYRGNIIRLRPRKLVVHPAYELTAREILKSAGRPDTANRADNELKGMASGIELVVDEFISSPTMWFVLCDKFEVYAFQHGGLQTDTTVNPFNKDNLVFGRFYMSTGAPDWLGTFAGSA